MRMEIKSFIFLIQVSFILILEHNLWLLTTISSNYQISISWNVFIDLKLILFNILNCLWIAVNQFLLDILINYFIIKYLDWLIKICKLEFNLAILF